MEQIANVFTLYKNSIFFNEKNEQIKYHGCSEVKGIKVGDGRMYLMDLMRLSPRDIYYSDKK